ncbi:MAG: HEAT repeat domain-containing protein, partial [Pirellulaceae bacterium]
MINSLRDVGDGWIYACHGFNNQSEVAGTDGHVVTMHSGNTFRFRPDGSRVENFTHGQVNPFGMTVDEWGYLYSADCHSKPITQLIRGATAIGEEQPDFLTSDDPWFRPVDLQLGPDGYIYVADFYNKIIGHYKVPLEHPERDRTSGRIWQIRYVNGKNLMDSAAQEALLEHNTPTQRLEALHDDDTLRKALNDKNPHVVRAAAELLGRQGHPEDISDLLRRLSSTPEQDPVLKQTIRIAARNLLNTAPTDADVWSQTPDADLASILLGVQRPEASATLLAYLSAHPNAANRDELLSHAAKNADRDLLGQCVRVAREITSGDRAKQFELLDVLCESQNARPENVAQPLRQWAQQLVQAELADIETPDKMMGWSADDGSTWPTEKRKLRGGGEAMVVSSLGRGETYTGKLVSNEFASPDQIVFWIAGHNGFPKEADHGKNRMRLVLVATGEVLHEVTPPRNDTAQQVHWDTSALLGRDVRIECIDGDSGTAYAWFAFGNFSAAWMNDASDASALTTSLDWIKRLGLDENTEALKQMLTKPGLSRRSISQIARTIASLRGNPEAEVTLQYLHRSSADRDSVKATIDAMLKGDRDAWLEATKQLCKRLSSAGQRDFAIAWATSGAEIESLLNMAQSGWISREVLVDPTAAQAFNPRLTETQQLRVKELTASVKADTQSSEILSQLKTAVPAHQGDRENGHRRYTKHCAVCHQLRSEGAVVGPQLDGAVTRSVERLLEDIVTPDRNIDEAFRTTSFLLDDGRVIVGLVTSETANDINVVQSDGTKVRIESNTIERR